VNRPWCLATRVSVGAAAGWLAFTVLHRLFSGRLWLWHLPDLLPPITFLVVPVALLAVLPLARALRRPLPRTPAVLVAGAAVLGLVLGVGYSGLNPRALAAGPVPAPPGAVRVFAWNTEYWDQHDDAGHFYRFLRAQHADVYLLEEYLNWDERAGLDGARKVDDRARLEREFPGYQLASRGELLTLSRFPVVATPRVGPDQGLGDGPAVGFAAEFDAAKVLRTDVRVGATVLSTYNVHLPVQVDLAPSRHFLGYVKERDAARREQLRGLSADLAANPHPAIVAGDFNTSPAMDDLDGIRAVLHDAIAADDALYPVSWRAGPWLPLWRLDWAFTTPGVPVYEHRFLDCEGLSDHRAQMLLVSVGGAR
jgi:endonuclease/exonuclease/phosphatase (EEP) superfamily protein YafD